MNMIHNEACAKQLESRGLFFPCDVSPMGSKLKVNADTFGSAVMSTQEENPMLIDDFVIYKHMLKVADQLW